MQTENYGAMDALSNVQLCNLMCDGWEHFKNIYNYSILHKYKYVAWMEWVCD